MVLRVKLEVVPYGDEDKAYEIGRLDIFNKGRVEECCEYGCIELYPKGGGLHIDTVYHPRKDGAWKLVKEVLTELGIAGPP